MSVPISRLEWRQASWVPPKERADERVSSVIDPPLCGAGQRGQGGRGRGRLLARDCFFRASVSRRFLFPATGRAMQGPGDELESTLREALEALRQGRPAEARQRIEELTESGADGEAPWLLLAAARGAERNLEGEAAAGAIRAELLKLLEGDGEEFRPYIRSDNETVPLRGNKSLLNSRDWSVLGLCERGWLAPDL